MHSSDTTVGQVHGLTLIFASPMMLGIVTAEAEFGKSMNESSDTLVDADFSIILTVTSIYSVHRTMARKYRRLDKELLEY
jgi:hypothetical protein